MEQPQIQHNQAPRSEAQKKYQVVYTVVTRERDGQKFWLRIGAAFPNRDGSLSVKLDAMPTNGELQIRYPRESGAQPEAQG